MTIVTTQSEAQKIAVLLNTSIKAAAFYPRAHQAVKQPMEELFSLLGGIFEDKSETYMGVVEGAFFFEDHIFVTPNASVAELAGRLQRKDLNALTLLKDIGFEELFNFVFLLSQKDSNAETMPDKMQSVGIRNVRLCIERWIEDPDGEAATVRTYNEALKAVRGVMREIESGRIPSSREINTVVDRMVSMTMKDQTTLLGLSMIKDYDNYTFNHSVNVGILSLALGAFLGMDRESLMELNTAGLLHDIGKTKIDKKILLKPGKLNAAEFEIIKTHPDTGSKIVGRMDGISPVVFDAVLGHHLKHNRQGYPDSAKGIPYGTLTGIVAISDTYDAMTTLRSYNAPFSPKAAVDTLMGLRGTCLDAELTDKFIEMMGKYPVGTLVRLDNNEIAVVTKPNPADAEAPEVKVVIEADGRRLESGRKEQLLRGGNGDGRYARIVSTVDPFLKNIDVATYLV